MLANGEANFDHNDLEGRPRTDITSNNQSRGPNRWSAVQGDVLRSFASTDTHCKNKVQRGVTKYLKRKLLPPY